MKLKNVVEGTQIEAKRNTTGECGEAIAKGAVLDVAEVLEECPRGTYCVRVEAEYLEDGFAWVVPADFRKVKGVTEKPTELHAFREGDVLLCTTACEGKHDEQCIAGRLYTYACASRIHLHRICVADPELYLEQATVLPENFTLYARKVGEDAAL